MGLLLLFRPSLVVVVVTTVPGGVSVADVDNGKAALTDAQLADVLVSTPAGSSTAVSDLTVGGVSVSDA